MNRDPGCKVEVAELETLLYALGICVFTQMPRLCRATPVSHKTLLFEILGLFHVDLLPRVDSAFLR